MAVFVETAAATVLVGSLPELIVLVGGVVSIGILVAMMLSGADWVFKRGSNEIRRVEKAVNYTV